MLLAVVFGIIATLIPAWYHGTRTFRWGEDETASILAGRLKGLPGNIGSWQMVDEGELRLEEIRQLQPVGYLVRRYSFGEMNANVFVIVGPTGPIAAHTPDICFDSRNYEMLDDRSKFKIGTSALDESECWVRRFESRAVQKQAIKTWYTWMVDKSWQASTNPRVSFSDSPYLIKVQVAVLYPDVESMDRDKVGEEFMTSLHDSLNETLFQ